MEEGHFASIENTVSHETHERPGIAKATMIGMRADAADLGEPDGLHVLASHSDAASLDLYAKEIPQFRRAGEERTGLGQGCKGKHFRSVRFAQRHHFERGGAAASRRSAII